MVQGLTEPDDQVIPHFYNPRSRTSMMPMPYPPMMDPHLENLEFNILVTGAKMSGKTTWIHRFICKHGDPRIGFNTKPMTTVDFGMVTVNLFEERINHLEYPIDGVVLFQDHPARLSFSPYSHKPTVMVYNRMDKRQFTALDYGHARRIGEINCSDVYFISNLYEKEFEKPLSRLLRRLVPDPHVIL